MNEYLQDEREIKAYIEVEYSNVDDTLPTGTETFYPTEAPISSFSDYNNKKISENYASLEQDYFLLDGSFVLPYKPENEETYNNNNSGYISNVTAEYLTDYFVINQYIGASGKDCHGITIYFKDNIPKKINLEVTSISNNVYNYSVEENDKEVVSFRFGFGLTVTELKITCELFEHQDRRIRIPQINFGLTDLLKGNNLIQFNIVENIGELNLEMPSNQLTINIYDEEDKFNIFNPKGYADLLNQGSSVKLKPYIGILTENNGIKYNEEMATFYLKDWTNNKKEITLNCVDYFEILKNTKSASRIGTSANYGNNENKNMLLGLDALIENETGIEFDDFVNFDDGTKGTFYYDDTYVTTTNVFDYLAQFMIWVWGFMYCANKIQVKPRNEIENYNNLLNLDYALLEDPIYTLKEPLKKINISKYSGELIKEQLETEVYYGEYLYNKYLENLIVTFTAPCDVRAEFGNFSQTWENVTSVDLKSWATALYESGEITVYITAFYTSQTSSVYTKDINNIGKTIEITNKFFKEYSGESGSYADELQDICNQLANKILEEHKKYNVKFNYIGDPNIKPNMIVPIETRYGNKEIKVLKHSLTFNGGLTGSIEGVGD